LRYLAGLLEKNEAHSRAHHARYEALAAGQSPKLVIALCSDSRLQTCIFGDSLELLGELFVARDIGNTYTDSEGAVDYAVRHLHVPLLLIMGHTGCGAAKAAAGDSSEETPAIKARLSNLKLCGDEGRDPQANVDEQVRLAMVRYSDWVSDGRLTVIGGVFDLIGAYGGLAGKIYITNVNNSNNISQIRKEIEKDEIFTSSQLDSTLKRL